MPFSMHMALFPQQADDGAVALQGKSSSAMSPLGKKHVCATARETREMNVNRNSVKRAGDRCMAAGCYEEEVAKVKERNVVKRDGEGDPRV